MSWSDRLRRLDDRALKAAGLDGASTASGPMRLSPPAPDERSGYWFKVKRFGWGWGLPSAWQGWATLMACVAALAVPQAVVSDALAAVIAMVATVALTCVLAVKGEPPRWRWGG